MPVSQSLAMFSLLLLPHISSPSPAVVPPSGVLERQIVEGIRYLVRRAERHHEESAVLAVEQQDGIRPSLFERLQNRGNVGHRLVVTLVHKRDSAWQDDPEVLRQRREDGEALPFGLKVLEETFQPLLLSWKELLPIGILYRALAAVQKTGDADTEVSRHDMRVCRINIQVKAHDRRIRSWPSQEGL
jgi:hypothetical protein